MVIGRMLLGAGLGVGVMLLALLLEGGHLSSVIGPTSAFLVLGGTAGAMIMAYPLRVIARSFRIALGRETPEPKDLVLGQKCFATMGQYFVMTGIIGTVVGLIHVMENLDRPERIGPGIAVAFLTMLYGFGFRLFWSGALYDSLVEKSVGNTILLSTPTLESAKNGDQEVQDLRAKVGELTMQIDLQNRKAA